MLCLYLKGHELRGSQQSFHWFANMTALREIHRVLKPQGCLGMVWNIDDYNSTRDFKPTTLWESKVQDLLWTFDDNEPRYRHNKWREVFDEQVKSTPLSLIVATGEQLFTLPLAEHDEKFEVRLLKDKVWERFNTLSHIALLENKEREVSGGKSSSRQKLTVCSKRIRRSWTRSTAQKWKLTTVVLLPSTGQRRQSGRQRYRARAGKA